MPRTLTLETMEQVGRSALSLTRTLTYKQTRERWMHGLVLGLLEAEVGDMQSEFRVGGGRIDFRHGGNNPDVIELVVVNHGNEHSPSQNLSELRKLCRVPYSQARRRILLILDTLENPVPKEWLRENYGGYNAGRGRFSRNTVTVVYVHPEDSYSFRWTPYR